MASIMNDTTLLYSAGFPYVDFYVGKLISQNVFSESKFCKHNYSDVWPSKREMVYNESFALNFPANPETVLRKYYGPSWRIPKISENGHGDLTICKYKEWKVLST